MNRIKTLNWFHCYDRSLKAFITPESFAHPAKMSAGLITRILRFMLEKKMIQRGDTILDPFGGIGTTGIFGAQAGMNILCVELEQKFVDLAQANFEKNRKAFEACGYPIPRIVQGDSRKLSEIVEGVGCVVTSPPYADGLGHGGNATEIDKRMFAFAVGSGKIGDYAYGRSSGQIATLREGNIDAVLTSCPFGETQTIRNDGNGDDPDNIRQKGYTNPRTGKIDKGMMARQYHPEKFSPSNISNLKVAGVITSPPYEGTAVEKNSSGIDHRKQWQTYLSQGGSQTYERFVEIQEKHSQGYGNSEGQIGGLRGGMVDGVVTSPPYEDSVNSGVSGIDFSKVKDAERRAGDPWGMAKGELKYGDSPQNIGTEKNETYWTAMQTVYGECYKVLKSGGWIAVVVKDFVRAKKIVPLCDNTVKLLQSLGFKVEYRARAWVSQKLNDDLITGKPVRKERKSFFRRLAEQKGSPRIDFEEVIFACKPKA